MKLPLGLKPEHSLARDQKFVSLLRNIERENLNFIIKRMQKKHGFSRNKAERARITTLRYLAMSTISDIAVVPIDNDCDEFWHEMIIHTKFYAEFCLKFFGYFLHHEPANDSMNNSIAIKNFKPTIKIYHQIFDVSTDPKVIDSKRHAVCYVCNA